LKNEDLENEEPLENEDPLENEVLENEDSPLENENPRLRKGNGTTLHLLT